MGGVLSKEKVLMKTQVLSRQPANGHTSELGILLLDVAQIHHQLLTGNALLVYQVVPMEERHHRGHTACTHSHAHTPLSKPSQVAGENVGIGSDASHAASHIARRVRYSQNKD